MTFSAQFSKIGQPKTASDFVIDLAAVKIPSILLRHFPLP
jgi:hypothetical protein